MRGLYCYNKKINVPTNNLPPTHISQDIIDTINFNFKKANRENFRSLLDSESMKSDELITKKIFIKK